MNVYQFLIKADRMSRQIMYMTWSLHFLQCRDFNETTSTSVRPLLDIVFKQELLNSRETLVKFGDFSRFRLGMIAHCKQRTELCILRKSVMIIVHGIDWLNYNRTFKKPSLSDWHSWPKSAKSLTNKMDWRHFWKRGRKRLKTSTLGNFYTRCHCIKLEASVDETNVMPMGMTFNRLQLHRYFRALPLASEARNGLVTTQREPNDWRGKTLHCKWLLIFITVK